MKAFLILLIAASAGFAADNGRLKTEVDPGRAGVFIDGKYVGPAANFKVAQTYDVAPGEHEIKLVDPRYQDFTTKVTIAAGKKTILRQAMTKLPAPKPPFGKLHFENADHFAAVYINDKFMGHVDEFSNSHQVLLLNPGTYEAKIVPRTGAPIVQTVMVVADQTTTVH